MSNWLTCIIPSLILWLGAGFTVGCAIATYRISRRSRRAADKFIAELAKGPKYFSAGSQEGPPS